VYVGKGVSVGGRVIVGVGLGVGVGVEAHVLFGELHAPTVFIVMLHVEVIVPSLAQPIKTVANAPAVVLVVVLLQVV
jgi:hypothetical protein